MEEIQTLINNANEALNNHDQKKTEEIIFDLISRKVEGPIISYLLGRLHFLKEEYKKSAEFFELAVKSKPNIISLRINLIKAYLKIGEKYNAIKQLERIYFLDEFNPESKSLFREIQKLK